MFKHELRAFLEAHNIPLQQWGQGEAKTFDDLFSEVTSGEAILTEEDGKLLRSVEGGTLNVYHDDGMTMWFLQEEKQVFKDGRSRTRTLNASIGEKMKCGEDPLESAYRALSEELGIAEKLQLIPKQRFIKGPIPSPSFPGLYSIYTMHMFDVFLPSHLYRPEGYVEHQVDKSSYFVWRKFSDKEART